MKLNYFKFNRLKYYSLFNFKLYKLFLNLKLLKNNFDLNKISIVKKIKTINYKTTPNLNIFLRKTKVPLRILRYSEYLQKFNLPKTYILQKFFSKKIFVYNGKRLKPINIFKGDIEQILKCNFKFGDFILTRVPNIFKKKKK